jgi:hypothetical protein
MNNPSHRQKQSKDDAPDWWIHANREAMAYGFSVVLITSDKDPEHIPYTRHDELMQAMRWAQVNRAVDIPSQES